MAHLVVLGVLVVVEEDDLYVAFDLDIHILAVNVHKALLRVALLDSFDLLFVVENASLLVVVFSRLLQKPHVEIRVTTASGDAGVEVGDSYKPNVGDLIRVSGDILSPQ